MKLPLVHRILLALTALLLLGGMVCLFLEMSYTTSILPAVHDILTRQSVLSTVAAVIGALILLVLLVNLILVILYRGNARGYVSVRSGGGQLRISVEALENLVKKSLSAHSEINVSSIALFMEKDGLNVQLHGTMPIGMDIPEAVSVLQEEIKQYLAVCSGVTVKNVNVLVDDTLGTMPLPSEMAGEKPEAAAEAPAETDEVPAAEETAEPEVPETQDEMTLDLPQETDMPLTDEEVPAEDSEPGEN